MKVIDILNKLKNAKKFDPVKINKDEIPSEVGIYAWFSKLTLEIQYIGIALGKKGLNGRIVGQHLNPNYLETRKSKQNQYKDYYQLEEKPVFINNKKAIDKSAFRKNVARIYKLTAGESSVNFLKENFLISFIAFPLNQKELVKDIEKELIHSVLPKYNIANKIS